MNWETVPYCECPARDIPGVALKAGDLLVARIGATTGKTFIVKQAPAAVFASYLIRITCKPDLVPDFLYNFTNSELYWRQIEAAKGGRLKQGVNIPVLQGLLLPKPPLSDQREIAEQLSAVDAKLAAEEARRAALNNLFKSLLHHLMTGMVRVPLGHIAPLNHPADQPAQDGTVRSAEATS